MLGFICGNFEDTEQNLEKVSRLAPCDGTFYINKAGYTAAAAGGEGPYLRSVEHLGRSGIAKNPINAKKVKCDGPTDRRTDRPTDRPTDGRTDGPTKRGVESRSTRLKNVEYKMIDNK